MRELLTVTFFYRREAAVGATILDNDLELPQLVLKQSALEHNLAAMQRFCSGRGASLAPHVKTTMAPYIIRRQLESGAWGVTVASMHQLRTCLKLGVSRVLYANEQVGHEAARWLAGELAARGPETLHVICLVDSISGVERLQTGVAAAGVAVELPVLVEIGPLGGRAGCRSVEAALDVARAVVAQPNLRLHGVEGFEGILGRERTAADLAKVDAFFELMVASAERLDREGLFGGLAEVVLSGGGSLYPDRAAEVLASARLGRPRRVVLRSGCYVTHDHGRYAGGEPVGSREGEEALVPALELWSEVISTPEAGLAIAGFGKRHAPFDAGLPVPIARMAAGVGALEPLEDGVRVVALNDQHAYIDVNGGRLDVGDRLVFGIIHPCTAFDHWREIPLADDGYRIVRIVETSFS